ncbi:MAG: diguanylate cyclase/phosphodiesterase [Lacrimispora sp.]|jgi:diguanylate cyclase (GGDEF)-like protein|nr:diguanylate cyclase/phosphodiesterase [Lacrimispora sp.]
MNKLLYQVLDNLNEGIVILNDDLEVIYWNNYMEDITGLKRYDILNQSVIDVLPNLSMKYYLDAFYDVKEQGTIRFFSGAIHKHMLNISDQFNLKMTRIENDDKNFIQLEFINVTSQFNQIKQLKSYVNKLWDTNKELKEKEKIIQKLAYHDKLTGAANRSLFYEVSASLLLQAKRNKTLLGLIFCDVNKFKSINDTYGHEFGDKVLIHISRLLEKAARESDMVCRYGGDEFVILLPDMKEVENYNIVASRITKLTQKPVKIQNITISLSISGGISFYPIDANTIDQLLVKADAAMYMAKQLKGMETYFYRMD